MSKLLFIQINFRYFSASISKSIYSKTFQGLEFREIKDAFKNRGTDKGMKCHKMVKVLKAKNEIYFLFVFRTLS